LLEEGEKISLFLRFIKWDASKISINERINKNKIRL